MESKKLKVVWLCYFSNQHVQEILKPKKPGREFAPWISSMISLFENDESIELHIVSQHDGINRSKTFMRNGIKYHFFNPDLPIIGRHLSGLFWFDVRTDFLITKLNIDRIVKKIKPDIIHMHGAENKFCTAITQFYKKYPVFITVQGFIHKSSSNSYVVRRRSRNELKIFRMFNHFGYRTETMGQDIKALNPQSVLHWHNYPMKEITLQNVIKKFDLVFFARVSKDKGIGDLLEAVSIIKKDKKDISLCVIGNGDLELWKGKAVELNISENVFWAGFLPTQGDVHKMASTARICVLPTYHDIISGTIVESLFLKIPVVAYNVGSIHEVNKNEKIIFLVEKGDITGLAKSILNLLDNTNLQQDIALKGYHRAQEMFSSDNVAIRSEILNAYSDVITDFYSNLNRTKP